MPLIVIAQKIEKKKPIPLATYGENVKETLTQKERKYIIEAYGDKAEDFVFNNPQRLKEFKHILRNRVVIEFYKNKDLSSITPLSKVPFINSSKSNIKSSYIFNPEMFNPLLYMFDFFSSNSIKYYHVDNTQYLIKILPQH